MVIFKAQYKSQSNIFFVASIHRIYVFKVVSKWNKSLTTIKGYCCSLALHLQNKISYIASHVGYDKGKIRTKVGWQHFN